MKKILRKILIPAWLILLAAGICACATGEGEPDVPDSVEVHLSVTQTEEGVTLSWNEERGVSYHILRAPSRFGEYERIASDVKGGTYEEEGDAFSYFRVRAEDGEGNLLGISDTVSMELDLFGENVYIFSPEDDLETVQKVLNSIETEMERAHFTDTRYAVFFKPGDYGDLLVRVPYFTTFAGLGASYGDVTVGALNCEGDWNTNSLINFWRGAENLTFNANSKWAVSQGTFLRSVRVNGNLDLHDDGMYASGGFLANSIVSGTVNSGSQQQWFTRNTVMGGWSGGVWNMVFAGVANAPSGGNNTSVATLPVLREKPYLAFEEGQYVLKIPKLRRNAAGIYTQVATSSDLYFARANRDDAASINREIEAGKHIVFLPGVYRLSEPVKVDRAGTVLLGTGLATLTPTGANSCLEVGDCDGVSVCGLLFDAGTSQTDVLCKVGKTSAGHADDPIFLYDCFFRIGGNSKETTFADISLEIDAGDVVCDNIWLWRADHGDGVGWAKNNGNYGMVVRGDHVKCYGLFAEHYKKNNVLWSGDDGYLVFYQSELAYDVPSAAAWTSEFGQGFPSIAVTDDVTLFAAYGLGIYTNFSANGQLLGCAMRLPAGSGIYVKNLCGVSLNGKASTGNLINSDGKSFGSTIRTEEWQG